MPRTAPGQLTEKQERYCELVLSGLDSSKAAELAGYEGGAQAAYHLSRNPKIIAVITASAGRQVALATGMAVRTLIDLLDAKNPPATRLGAAKTILDRAGIVEKTGDNKGLEDGKPLMEMTESELKATLANVDRLRDSLDSALHPRVIDHQAIEIIGEDTTP